MANELSLALAPLGPNAEDRDWRRPEIEWSWLNVLLISLFIHVGFFATTALFPYDTSALREDMLSRSNRFVRLLVVPVEERAKPALYQRLMAASSGKAARAHSGAEGAAGSPAADDQQRRMAFKGPSESDESVVRRQFEKVFGTEGSGGVGSVFGGDLGGDLVEALGGVVGPSVGATRGIGGLGLRGDGPGGGGDGLLSYGVGAIGTRGRGSGEHGYGDGGGGLRPKTERDIDVATGRPEICDAFDKAAIRRVIRDNIAQIRYCYERELTREPGLDGKVSVKFVIGSKGRVVNALVAETTLGNDTVEQCVLSKVRSWRFTAPRGGGIGVVTYPFIFKHSG